MNTPIRDFCQKYQDKVKNDKEIKETKVESWNDCRDRISFYISEITHTPGTLSSRRASLNLIKLDDSDLEYLYNKYSKLLIKEMEDNIAEIKSKYGN